MPSATSAVVGWSVVFLVAGGFYFVTSQRKNKNRRTVPVKGASKLVESRKESKSKKTRRVLESSRGKQEVRITQKARKASIGQKPSQATTHKNHESQKVNGELEKPLIRTKAETSGSSTSDVSEKPKSLKQATNQEKQRAESPDNATGNEADDESAHTLLKFNSKISSLLPASQDVSDMLEKPSPQPNVLNISAPKSNQSKKTGSRKPAQKEEQIETKKQRQNRRKVAEAKLARAQEELERKEKMESQRRTARVAEGRAAKDGSSFMASQKPESSAWIAQQPLLSDPKIISTSASVNSESEDHGSTKQEVSVLSEEEQVRHVIKETETWSVVKGKDKRNRTAKSSGDESLKTKVPSEAKIQEFVNISSTPATSAVPSRVPNNFLQNDRNFAEENNSGEDSEWEVS